MATDKKSVLLYCDILHTVKELSNEEAGQLFKHYLEYINDLNPEPPSKLIKIVFEPIKQNLKRDLRKWEGKSLKNSEIAKLRWSKRTDANACERIKVDANHADKDKVTVTDKVIVKDKDINYYRNFKHLKLSLHEFDKLIELGWNKEQIDKILDSIENYKKNTSYTSLYLTSKKWLEKEYSGQRSKPNQIISAYQESKKLLGI